MTNFLVSKSSCNLQTGRATFISRSFTDYNRAALFFSESKWRAVAKARKTGEYRCTIWLQEQDGNLFRQLEREDI